MKFSLNRSDLLEPLSKVVSVLEKRQTLPILSHVLVAVNQHGITLTATDQEVELQTQIGLGDDSLNVEVEGLCALPGRKLLEICKHLPVDARLNFRQRDKHVVLSSGAFESQFSTLPAEDFPNIDGQGQAIQSFRIETQPFRQMLAKTVFAMAQQDVRYFFNGMLFELNEGTVRLVATNGQRLAVVTRQVQHDGGLQGRPIVPRKGVLELVKLLDEVDTEVTLSFTENCLLVEMTGCRFLSKLIDGEYPDYEKAIPTGSDKHFSCDRQAFREALIRTAVMSNEVYKNVKLSLVAGRLSLFTNNPLQEQAEETLAVVYEGEDLEIGFNVHFLIEALNAVGSEVVQVALSGQTSPCLITDPEEEQAQFVISPMVI
jgi:DNA polymerase-3 subunit beta